MKTKKVWKVSYTRIIDHDTNISGWETKMVTADTIEKALEVLRQYGNQESWTGLDIYSVEFSHKLLRKEESDE